MARAIRTVCLCEVIDKLSEMFGKFGYTRQLISDRGLAFTSKVFVEFLAGQQINHVLNAMEHIGQTARFETRNNTIISAIGASTEWKTRGGFL